MTELRRMPTLFALVLSAGLAVGCASMGSPSISEVQANPGRYSDRTVTVTGVVTTSWGVPLVPYRMYRVSDGQAEILVLSDGRTTPGKGARVRVRGEVEEFAVFGGKSLGLHVREKSLKVL
jgi:ABC-type Fe3+-hydroxamate transport system substrate-binding protein